MQAQQQQQHNDQLDDCPLLSDADSDISLVPSSRPSHPPKESAQEKKSKEEDEDQKKKKQTIPPHNSLSAKEAAELAASGVPFERIDFFRVPDTPEDEVDFSDMIEIQDPLLDILAIMLSIASVMSSVSTFIREVPPSEIEAVGKKNFTAAMYTVQFFPMAFSLLLIIVKNNHLSKVSFYKMLQKQLILDFCDSESAAHMIRNAKQSLFLVASIAYCACAALFFVRFEASLAIWILFFKQFGMEIMLFWFGMQNLESSVVTLPEFIEAYDDRDRDDPKIDDYTIRKAGKALMKFHAIQVGACFNSETSQMLRTGDEDKIGLDDNDDDNDKKQSGGGITHTARRHSRRAKNWVRRMVNRHGMTVLTVILTAGLCFAAYIQVEQEKSEGEVALWQDSVSPCVEVCFARSKRDPKFCASCVCACSTLLGTTIDPETCEKSLVVPGCSDTGICKNPPASCFAHPGD